MGRKPRTALEGDLKAGVGSGGLQTNAVNVGSNQGPWYFQLGASYSDRKWTPLSSDYRPRSVPTSATNPTRNVLENGGHRENSQSSDSRLSLKIGLTPNATDEYAIGSVKQEGSKGNPPYAGDAPGQYLNIGGGANSRFWRWPYWNLESTYFIGNIALGREHMLKARVYQDNYDNKILGAGAGAVGRRQDRRGAWYVRRFGHEHGDPAGDHRHLPRGWCGGRLFGGLPVRCRRPDPLHLRAQGHPQTEDRTAANQVIELAEITLHNSEFVGRRLSALAARLPPGVAIAAIRREHHNQLPSDSLMLRDDDVLLATSTSPEALKKAAAQFGELQRGRMTSHREDLDYQRMFASSKAVVGVAPGDLRFP